jgi:hypothetical protein
VHEFPKGEQSVCFYVASFVGAKHEGSEATLGWLCGFCIYFHALNIYVA